MQLDKTTTTSGNFIFAISSTLSIESVHLDIALRFIIFHIVPLNTLFLICLADIDKLRVFVNNVTDQVIQSHTYTDPAQSYLIITKYDHIFLLWHTFVKIKDLSINKTLEKSCILAKNLSTISPIAC